MLDPVRDISVSGSSLRIRSGSVVVLQESACPGVTGSASMRMRWRDGRQWSSSKLCGSFLLYREVAKSDNFVEQAKEDTTLFSGLSLRQGTHIVPNGLAKRTISVDGSDNNRYRVISYFFPADVQDHYKKGKRSRCILPTPSQLPEFSRFEARVEEMNSVYTRNNFDQQQQQQKQQIQSPSQTSPIAASPMVSTPRHLNGSLPTPNFEPLSIYHSAPPPVKKCCPCGGLKNLSAFDYFKRDRSWLEQPVYLRPIRRLIQ
ncbi:hypothetical protein CcCBS67573_g03340 [Chytriomyces confervae]|uniref:Uncharacterized protein n=1 Tax=Chytriomyces confervae TaxID=246404 RepID=A0A507FK00_9FUNG|nr:hypothetical protein CcCBS67573_g03340 [Chytriomyces confervae]